MRFALLTLGLVLAATGCRTSQSDYDHLLSDSLASVQKAGPVRTIVLAPALPAAARESARNFRPVIEQSALPNGASKLPSGHFLLKSISISGQKAHVKGSLGPVQDHPPLCGTQYDFAYSRFGWRWRRGDLEMMVC